MQTFNVETEIAHAATPAALWQVIATFFSGTSVDRVSYIHFPPLGATDARDIRIWSDGFPDALVARYIEERMYRYNPILATARAELEPVYWIDVEEIAVLNPQEEAFVAAFRAANMGYGVGIPVYGPSGRDGHCGLGFVDGVVRLQPDVLRSFQWVCELGHLRYCALLLQDLGPLPRLSQREREVLSWVARGKSNGLIGDILGISPHTVDAHMRRICLKLGVSDRISAAVRGIGVGLIHAAAA